MLKMRQKITRELIGTAICLGLFGAGAGIRTIIQKQGQKLVDNGKTQINNPPNINRVLTNRS
jgi:glycerol uptake facilitator-like aquaporin